MKTAWPDFKGVRELLSRLGTDLLRWREDPAARHLHSQKSFTTEADLRADAFLKEGLGRLTPGVPVLSEEDVSPSQERPERYWLIDPIDGTASWRGGFRGFVTQVALIEGRLPCYGLVRAPALGRSWEALRGCGARLNETQLPRREPGPRCMLVDNTPRPHGIAARLATQVPITGYLESGSLGLKAVLVADGSADLFVKRVPVRDWDLAPAAVILSEVGASLTTGNGAPWDFSGPMLKQHGLIAARDKELLEKTLNALSVIDSEDRA